MGETPGCFFSGLYVCPRSLQTIYFLHSKHNPMSCSSGNHKEGCASHISYFGSLVYLSCLVFKAFRATIG